MLIANSGYRKMDKQDFDCWAGAPDDSIICQGERKDFVYVGIFSESEHVFQMTMFTNIGSSFITVQRNAIAAMAKAASVHTLANTFERIISEEGGDIKRASIRLDNEYGFK